jgi:hypothetical protein
MWKQSQPQSNQKEAGSEWEAKVDPNRMQSGSKSMEHARRNGFATEALMPLLATMRDFCHWVANQPQDVIRDVITVDW